MPVEGQNVTEHLTEKQGSTPEQQTDSKQNMTAAEKELDFTFDYFDEMRMVHTFNAHILLEYANNFGKQTQLKRYLTTAFFSKRKDVSKREILKQALLDIGLNVEEGFALIANEYARNRIREKQNYCKGLGVNSV